MILRVMSYGQKLLDKQIIAKVMGQLLILQEIFM